MSEVKMADVTEVVEKTGISREKKIEKVIQGNVRTRKRSMGKKMMDSFISEDADTIRSYIVMDVIVPEIKEIIMETVNVILFGGTRAPAKKKNQTYVSYNSYSSPSYKNQQKASESHRRTVNDLNDVIFESRGEAEEVLASLIDIVVDYEVATVADFYDLVGITGSFTDNKYGWTSFQGVGVSRARGGGYIINLPRPVFID